MKHTRKETAKKLNKIFSSPEWKKHCLNHPCGGSLLDFFCHTKTQFTEEEVEEILDLHEEILYGFN